MPSFHQHCFSNYWMIHTYRLRRVQISLGHKCAYNLKRCYHCWKLYPLFYYHYSALFSNPSPVEGLGANVCLVTTSLIKTCLVMHFPLGIAHRSHL